MWTTVCRVTNSATGHPRSVAMVHCCLADEICVSLGYDKVLFVPVFSPPHKNMNGALPPEKRAKMVELACQDDPRFEIEPCEIQRGGISYTYDTVCFIEEKLLDVDQEVDMVKHQLVVKKDKKLEVAHQFIHGLKVVKLLYIRDYLDVDSQMLDLKRNIQLLMFQI